MTRQRVLVLGAGVAGLTAARHLAAGADVVVVDKGRGVGGRLATRRIGDATFDHGAQFVTARSPEFGAALAGWEEAGVVQPWYRTEPNGHTRHRGVPGMTAIAKHLAAGLDVRLGTKVEVVSRHGAGWALDTAGGALTCDAVVITSPVPQSLDLLSAGAAELASTDLAALGAIRYDPCIAAMVPLQGPSGLPAPGAVEPAGGPIGWMADNAVKGVSAVPAVTIHATPDASRDLWEAPDRDITDELLRAANLASPAVDDLVQVHRWRYARPTVLLSAPCLVAEALPPLVFAGDAFVAARVEGAALSGRAAAEALLRRADRRFTTR